MTSPAVSASAVEPRNGELETKLGLLRETLARHRLVGVRLRGQDWFAWATCGGSNAVLLASERGVAEVFVTDAGAWVLTDAIETARLRDEEVPAALEVVEFPWARPDERERFVRKALNGGRLASDLPSTDEAGLPAELAASRLRLLGSEVERYRSVGRGSAEAMTETLESVTPEATELEVAGIGAQALLRRGIEPALVLVGGSRRLDLYRHPRPSGEPVGDRVGVVFCGRRFGLYANLTRFVYFRQPTADELDRARAVALVEAAAWDVSRPGTTLGEVYETIASAYARLGFPGAERSHHQGGTTGYRARETVATPGDPTAIEPGTALAWNPSLPGTKIEDTVLCSAGGLEVLTVDPAWPSLEVEGRPRPDLRVVG